VNQGTQLILGNNSQPEQRQAWPVIAGVNGDTFIHSHPKRSMGVQPNARRTEKNSSPAFLDLSL
jgi:hypothetical protein